MTFEDYFMRLAHNVKVKSKDPSTKVGCVIVGPDNEIRSTGWNGFARGVDEPEERYERPTKYDFVVHAEANAIANAARAGIALRDCTAYVTHFPCKGCAGLLIQAGIKRVFVDGNGVTVSDHGQEIAKVQLSEANIECFICP